MGEFAQKFGHKISRSAPDAELSILNGVGAEECARQCVQSKKHCAGFDVCTTTGGAAQVQVMHSCSLDITGSALQGADLVRDAFCSAFLAVARNEPPVETVIDEERYELFRKDIANLPAARKTSATSLGFWSGLLMLLLGSSVGVLIVVAWRRRETIVAGATLSCSVLQSAWQRIARRSWGI